ncbi:MULTISPECIES: sulfotransferase [Gammaproteobacteria]|uniref:tetratricopeptide repeat-containing sulfotransferase family protein n=1 Tax=Gammaproteobacteria TaxID=1236 RepID=UPI000DCFA93A|nr:MULTISPECIES: sulfotransferase [Gammaproteobacteria]RTE85830.1 tetratricopeptide repeat protein [Aliidiomarina sp. B3213]TCZ90169.1 tetratricopeptide repeat protein [Lysobacter sp. N42]
MGHSPIDVNNLSQKALTASQNEDYALAVRLYEQCVSLSPNDATLHFNLASTYRILGNLEQARIHYSRSIALNENDAEAWYFRSLTTKATSEQNHIAQLQTMLNQKIESPKLEVHLWFALGKEFDDLKEWEQAKQAIQRGAFLRRKHIHYDVREDLNIMNSIKNTFHKSMFKKVASEDQEQPIFIVGLPRAGSTLVERILSMHEDITVAGELLDFPQAVNKAVAQAAKSGAFLGKIDSPKVSKTKLVELTSLVDLEAIRTNYLDSTKKYQTHTHFIDKNPLNFLQLGLIHQAFPNAKIIHVTRSKKAHMWSIFRHLFSHAYPFSYNLDEIEHYYEGYRQVMSHWHQSFGEQIFELEYESLVDAPQAEAKALFSFLGKAWDERFLEFHNENNAPSATGSASQIREPLNTHALNRPPLI